MVQIYPWIRELTSVHFAAAAMLEHDPPLVHFYVG